jgi:hypothetical protein
LHKFDHKSEGRAERYPAGKVDLDSEYADVFRTGIGGGCVYGDGHDGVGQRSGRGIGRAPGEFIIKEDETRNEMGRLIEYVCGTI